jgi:hypothetical protein
MTKVRLMGVVCAMLVLSACAPLATKSRPQHPWSFREERADFPASARAARPGVVDDPVPDGAAASVRARIAAAAGSTVGDRPVVIGGVRYRFDCSGVVAGIYARAGLPLAAKGYAPDTKALFALVEKNGSLRRQHPLPGDLVFFDNTWDENRNGHIDDPLSHVGVVEKILDDGTVVFVQQVSGLVVRSRLNLSHPHDVVDERGRTRNHWLRSAIGDRPAQTTGELFVAFGTLALTASGMQLDVLARR